MEDAWNTAKGWFGYRPEQKVGKDLGRYLGQLGSEYLPIPGVNGSQFGEWVGSFLPFMEGGVIERRIKPPPPAGIVRYPKGYIKLKTKMPKEGKKWAKKIKKLRQQDQVG